MRKLLIIIALAASVLAACADDVNTIEGSGCVAIDFQTWSRNYEDSKLDGVYCPVTVQP